MAAIFDYAQAQNTVSNIESLKTRLNQTLNEIDNLIKSNVNNDNVWNSDSSTDFMAGWTKYAEESFPAYLNSFEVQIKNITMALNTYSSTEA